MERYLTTFHLTKEGLLEFRTLKATRREANWKDCELRELMAKDNANKVHNYTATKCCQQADQDRLQRFNQQTDLICQESHIKFIKMHNLLTFPPRYDVL